MLCVDEDGICTFKNLTFCPYEREAIDVEMLTDAELVYINQYHKVVYENIAPYVDNEVKAWLAKACREIDTI